MTGRGGLVLLPGDRVVLRGWDQPGRRVDAEAGRVYNRDKGTLIGHHPAGGVTVHFDGKGHAVLDRDVVRERVDLAYAATTHGVQGLTVGAAGPQAQEGHGIYWRSGHGDHRNLYVAVTRGRTTNEIWDSARDGTTLKQELAAQLGRDRGDLVLAVHTHLAQRQTDHQPSERQVVPPRGLEELARRTIDAEQAARAELAAVERHAAEYPAKLAAAREHADAMGKEAARWEQRVAGAEQNLAGAAQHLGQAHHKVETSSWLGRGAARNQLAGAEASYTQARQYRDAARTEAAPAKTAAVEARQAVARLETNRPNTPGRSTSPATNSPSTPVMALR